MVIYDVITLFSQNGRDTYGILGREVDSDGLTLQTVSFADVCCDKDWMLLLVKRCNEGQLALEHLYDVIYDMLP